MATLIAGALSLACILFVLSLPISKSDAGTSLRRWALFCFLVAITPSVVVSLFREATGGRGGVSAGSVFGLVGFLAVIAVVAYLVLSAKGLVGGRRGEPGERGRARGGYRLDDTDALDD